MSIENSHLQNLMQIYDLSPLIKKPTCFRSDTPTCSSVVMKLGIFRGQPRKKVYRSYKNFDLEHFNIALKSELEKLIDSTYIEFETAFCRVLNKHEPIKVKMLRHNNNSFMTKNSRKAIMHRSKF